MISLKRISSFLLIAVFSFSLFSMLDNTKSEAVTASDWKPGRIIDDAVFFNKDAMSPAQIQQFLNSKVPVCNTYYNWSGWYKGYWNAPPWTCIKDYQENGKSAAQIIWEAGQRHGINPQVLIITLQKETAIITDTWAAPWQYKRATGYLCPDSKLGTDVDANQNGCYDSHESFTAQINGAAWQLKRYTQFPDSFNFKAGVTRNILWSPNGACGSSPVYIETQGTAALYNYTPYQPNAAALNNMYGSGDNCSTYGNRNFWRMFNDWFGSTVGPNYSWQLESLTYEGGDNVITLNSTERVVMKAKNTGRQPWYNHGNNPIRLGTWNPANSQSTLIQNSIRFASLKESVILPGQTGTFEFNLNPNKLGTFVQSMNLVSENNEWAAWPGFSPTIIVNSGYSSSVEKIIYEKGTGLMEPGSSQLVTIIIKNTGTNTWSKVTGPKIRLGTWEPDRRSAVGLNWLSSTRLTDMNETTVAPGQNAGFQFYIKMPSSGIYYEKINLVAEGQEWFPNQNLTLFLEGKSFSWQPLWHYHSTGTANISRNKEFNLTIKVRNTGSYSWYKNSGPKIRLATTGPQDRGSALYTSSWIRDTRPAELQEDLVKPGDEGTFIFKAKTPDALGPRIERFSLVAEGYTWMNDPGFSIYVNVVP